MTSFPMIINMISIGMMLIIRRSGMRILLCRKISNEKAPGLYGIGAIKMIAIPVIYFVD